MPYIVTVRPIAESPNEEHGVRAVVLSRRAVATLEEAQQVAFGIAEDSCGIGRDVQAQITAAHQCTQNEDGGSVSLADGTVIEVERVGLKWEMEQAERLLLGAETDERGHTHYTGRGCSPSLSRAVTTTEVIAAYNEAQT